MTNTVSTAESEIIRSRGRPVAHDRCVPRVAGDRRRQPMSSRHATTAFLSGRVVAGSPHRHLSVGIGTRPRARRRRGGGGGGGGLSRGTAPRRAVGGPPAEVRRTSALPTLSRRNEPIRRAVTPSPPVMASPDPCQPSAGGPSSHAVCLWSANQPPPSQVSPVGLTSSCSPRRAGVYWDSRSIRGWFRVGYLSDGVRLAISPNSDGILSAVNGSNGAFCARPDGRWVGALRALSESALKRCSAGRQTRGPSESQADELCPPAQLTPGSGVWAAG